MKMLQRYNTILSYFQNPFDLFSCLSEISEKICEGFFM